MSRHRFGVLSWRGYDLACAVPDGHWFEEMEAFTGLEVVPAAEGDTGIPTLLVIDERMVLVDGGALRFFDDAAHLKAWLYLTISDVMVTRGEMLTFHAASYLQGDQAVLISGQPWAGKSTWAETLRRDGLTVLGDDQVAVCEQSGEVTPLPRPCKQRLIDARAWHALSSEAIRTHLDGEAIALEPRLPLGLSPVHRSHRVSHILHLQRRQEPGVVLQPLEPFEAAQQCMGQFPQFSPQRFRRIAAVVKRWASIPSYRLEVGEGSLAEAIERARAIAPRQPDAP